LLYNNQVHFTMIPKQFASWKSMHFQACEDSWTFSWISLSACKEKFVRLLDLLYMKATTSRRVWFATMSKLGVVILDKTKLHMFGCSQLNIMS